ncbi:formyltransferase family protein [Kitasatospora sp. HPMI-4]|uniref:formyltransferase family protein n=1 Tax=Kitasatospora sp. HPMI-4 TaxID=3448443 RepID=UPI003F1D5121
MTDTAVRRLSTGGPLRIGVLVSATGANLRTLLAMEQAEPESFQVCLVASHGSRAKALDVAREHRVTTWTGDFDASCGLASEARDARARAGYRERARAWHDGLDRRIAAWETEHGALDLIVLAYHRWIEGDLLDRFRGRMINQHPGDLARLAPDGTRLLVGNDPVRLALTLGHRTTRTSCFLVDEGQDSGALLCQGPPVPTGGRTDSVADAENLELLQKERSDRPCLEWTVRAFAAGRLALAAERHPDGSPVVLVDGVPTPLGGRRLGDAGHD